MEDAHFADRDDAAEPGRAGWRGSPPAGWRLNDNCLPIMRPSLSRIALLTVVIYAIAGVLWILFSDALLNTLASSQAVLNQLQTVKGWFFVGATSLLLYALLRRQLGQLDAANEAVDRTKASFVESEARFRLFAEHASDSFLIHDDQGRILDVNQHACATSGYTKEELLQMNISDLEAALSATELKDVWERMQPSETPVVEGCLRTKDGREIPMEVRVACFEQGDRRRFLALARDISERKEAEAALRSEHNRLMAIFNALPDMYFRVDEHNVLVDCHTNNPDDLILGGNRILGRRVDDFMPEPALGLLVNGIERARSTRESVVVDYTLPIADGSRDFEARIAAVDSAQCVAIVRNITERKRAEAELEGRLRLERRLSRLAKAIPGALYEFRLNPDGSMQFPSVSPQMEVLFELQAEELSRDANHAFRLVHPDDLGALIDSITWSARDLSFWKATFRATLPKRGPIWVEGHAVPERGDDGSVVWNGFIFDVTERKLGEADHLRLLKRSESIVRALGEVVYEQDLTADTIEWDGDIQGCLGWPPAELGRDSGRWLDLVHPAHRAMARASLNPPAGRSTYTLEYQFRREDGNYEWLFDRGVIWRDDADRVTRMIGVLRNITRERADQDRLRESEERFRSVVSTLAEGIFIYDDRGVLTDCNESAESILGYTRDSLIGSTAADGRFKGIHEDGSPVPPGEHASIRALTTGEPQRNVIIGVARADGTRRWLSINALPISRAGAEHPHRVVLSFNDITARRESEIRQKTLEIQLRHAQKIEAVGTLAAGIAHDFNNILGAILGNVELARWELSENQPVDDQLDEIGVAATRAKNLVRQILTFSRQQPVQRELITIGPILDEGIGLLRATLPAGIDIVKEVAPDTPRIFADPSQLHQVVVNLSTNAWHAMKRGRGTITMQVAAAELDSRESAARPGLKPGRYAVLSVSDTGVGMTRQTMDRIFEPFFTTKEPGKGTGLGLAVVHGIIQAHDGCVTVESRPGEGSTFKVYLPASSQTSPHMQNSMPELPHGDSEHILFLDDEEPLVKLASRTLKRLGYQVSAFTEPEEALAAFEAAPDSFHAVITDYNMPGHSGIDFATRILGTRNNVPVILSSGFVSDELKQEATRVGIRQVIYKPNTIDELSTVLSSVLRG